MKSRTSRGFRRLLNALPEDEQQRARRAYRSWRENPDLPGLRFKRVGDDVSVRIGRDYRVLGVVRGDTVHWYWIGKHDEYNRRIS